MKIKKLNWIDNVTDLGKAQGLFEILANIKELGITYYIRNYEHWEGHASEKYYLSQSNINMITEHNNVEDAKLKAQECFEETILKLFFD